MNFQRQSWLNCLTPKPGKNVEQYLIQIHEFPVYNKSLNKDTLGNSEFCSPSIDSTPSQPHYLRHKSDRTPDSLSGNIENFRRTTIIVS